MGKPLDHLGSFGMRSTVESSAVQAEPTIEFTRKKSSVFAADSFDGSERAAASEFTPFSIADLPQIAVPREGGKALVTANDRHTKAALEAYKSVRTRLLRSQASQGFRSIAITSIGRGDGKTLTAFNLACCCAQVERTSVLLIDGDLQNRSLTGLIGKLPAAGLADVMRGASCEEAIVRTDVQNLYVMGAGKLDTATTELFSTERWGQLIRWSRNHFKIVIVDTLSMGASADFELIAPECDGILLIVRARTTPREALKMAVEHLDAKLIGIVWNGSDSEEANVYYS